MTEAKREARRESQRESYKRCKAVKANLPKSKRTVKKATEVYPLKKDADILAMEDYLLTHGRHNYRNYLYFMLGISLGRRGGDLAKLRWSDLLDTNGDFVEESYIREEKTAKQAMLTFNSDAREAILHYLDNTGIVPTPDAYVFKSAIKKEDYIEADSMRKILKDAAKAIGFSRNFGTHSLRKTFGYRLWMATQNLGLVQMLLGHSDPGITRRYIGLDEEMMQEAYDSISGINLPSVSAAVREKHNIMMPTTSASIGTHADTKPLSALLIPSTPAVRLTPIIEDGCEIFDFMSYRNRMAM